MHLKSLASAEFDQKGTPTLSDIWYDCRDFTHRSKTITVVQENEIYLVASWGNNYASIGDLIIAVIGLTHNGQNDICGAEEERKI